MINREEVITISSSFKNKTYIHSILTAWIGLKKVLKSEKNFKTHTIIGVITLLIDIVIGVDTNCLILTLISASNVFIAEVFNTVAERICDMHTKEFCEDIKFIKDIAAGGVLLAGIFFFIIQAIILGGALC